ncbi:chromosome alignment-maintaining phosphoprotein 1 [Mixophyes fleayi]|uniref:chromosome alignment-maintaining phosphoprotein 1 n=1 Tax=Mixophyes fleayi TaxID=3061075 RepID=UPI003F4DDD80
MEVLQKCNELDCNRCGFHGSDYKSVQIHMGTIHPEFCEEIDTAGLGKLVFYQKSARLFHCHRCFFTSKMFSNVYYHIIDQHAAPDRWGNETKPIVQPKSEANSVVDSDKNDSESVLSEDEKSIDEQDQKEKISEVVKPEENDTLTSWPEKMPSQDNQDNSDSEFKSSSIEKASVVSPEAKESSSDPELPESESSSNSDNISKANSKTKVDIEFSDNDAASSPPSKDIPEFSDEDEEPALPGGIPHFSEDEDIVTETKHVDESSEAQRLADQSRGIEDISEDEMPPEENPTEDDRALAQSKEREDSSEEEDALAPGKEIMEFSEDEEEDTPVLPKDIMEFSEDEEEETTNIPKSIIDFSEEEETANASKTMDFSEEETTNASKNIMEFSEEDETPGLSKDIMEFSDDDTPAMSKSIMEFSEEEDISPPSKDMPKYLEGNSTPTQSKDSEYVEDADASVLKGSSPCSEDDGVPDEGTSIHPKDVMDSSKSLTTSASVSGVLHLSENASNASLSKDGLDPLEPGDLSLSAQETVDASDDKDAFLKDEEILKHVKRVKGRFHCMLCDCRPLKRGPVLHHLITRHNMPSPFVCKTCGKTFVMETHLKNHLTSHTKGLYKCHRCNFQTDHARGFKKHQTHCESRHKEDANKSVLDFQEDDREED